MSRIRTGSGSSCSTDRPARASPRVGPAYPKPQMRSPDALSMPGRLRLTVRPIGRRDPLALFRRLQRCRWPFFLDPSLPDPELARYSFLGSDPIGWFRSRGPNAAYATPWGESSTNRNPLEAFGEFVDALPWATAGTPAYPFLGGPVGYFAYDLGRQMERLPDEKLSDLRLPDMHFAIYPRVQVLDRVWGETFVIAPRARITYEPPPIPHQLCVPPEPHPIEPLDPDAYVHTVEEAKRAIYDGEIYQVNLSHRVALPLRGTPTAAYERLRARTPSTFGGFLEAGDHRLLSASPERFLCVRGRDIETRPIKGTRPRGRTPAEGGRPARELLAREKDAAACTPARSDTSPGIAPSTGTSRSARRPSSARRPTSRSAVASWRTRTRRRSIGRRSTSSADMRRPSRKTAWR